MFPPVEQAQLPLVEPGLPAALAALSEGQRTAERLTCGRGPTDRVVGRVWVCQGGPRVEPARIGAGGSPASRTGRRMVQEWPSNDVWETLLALLDDPIERMEEAWSFPQPTPPEWL